MIFQIFLITEIASTVINIIIYFKGAYMLRSFCIFVTSFFSIHCLDRDEGRTFKALKSFEPKIKNTRQ
jgi:hypothetical protein